MVYPHHLYLHHREMKMFILQLFKHLHRLQEPHYIGDITAQHLSTPRKAQRVLKIAKDTIARQQRKIKSLQQCRNRLVTRITTLKSLVKHLEQKNLLTEVAAEHLKVNESNLKTLPLMNTFKSKNLCSNEKTQQNYNSLSVEQSVLSN